MSAADPRYKLEIGLIQMARVHLKLSREDYLCVLREVTGKGSSTELDAAGRDKLLRHFKAKGFVIKPKGGKARSAPMREAQVTKLMAMWYSLSQAEAVVRPKNSTECAAAVETWGKRQLAEHPLGPMDALRFATGEQLNVLVESMKRWGYRVKADIHP